MSHCGEDSSAERGEANDGQGAADAASSTGGSMAADGSASGGNAGAGGAGGATVGQVEPEWLVCETDADCSVLRIRACCACAIISANVEHTADVERVTEKHEGCPPCPPSPCPPIPEPFCNAGQCDYVVDCEAMERAQLCGELARCVNLSGNPCNGDGGTERIGCFPQTEMVPGDRCAENPDTGERLVFSAGQIPDGWIECDVAECQ